MSTRPSTVARQASFTAFQVPAFPTSGAGLEAEFNAIVAGLAARDARAAEIQRDDGKLANLSVHPDALSDEIRILLAAEAGSICGDWITAFNYELKDVVNVSGIYYLCVEAHTSGTFAIDLNAEKWMLLTVKDALLLNFTQQGTGAVERTIASKLYEDVSVTDFCLDGTLGIGNDDTAVFELAMGTGGRRVRVPEGIFLLDNCSIPSNTILVGQGSNTIIRPYSNGNPKLVLRVDANDYIEISHFKLEVDATTYPLHSCIWGQGCSNIHVHDVQVSQAGNIGIHFVNVIEVTVEHCTVTTANQYGIFISDAGSGNLRCKILNNVVAVAGSTHQGISVQGGYRCQVRGNSVNEAGTFGIQFNSCFHSIMAGNTTYNTYREGCNMSDSSFCIVDGNVCAWDGTAGEDFGISIAAPGGDCNMNRVTNNIIVNPQKSGIAVAAVNGNEASNNVIESNTIYNPNSYHGAPEAQGAGILLYGPNVIRTVVQGNKLYGVGANMKYGVHDWSVGGKPIQSKIRNNDIVSAVTDINRNTASADSMVSNNASALSDFTPGVASSTNSITTLGAVTAKYTETEKRVYVVLDIEITTNGAGAGYVTVNLPFTAAHTAVIPGRQFVVGGNGINGSVQAGTNQLQIRKYDNSYPGLDTVRLQLSGEFIRA